MVGAATGSAAAIFHVLAVGIAMLLEGAPGDIAVLAHVPVAVEVPPACDRVAEDSAVVAVGEDKQSRPQTETLARAHHEAIV